LQIRIKIDYTEIDLRMHFYHEDSIYMNDKSLILQ